MLPDSLFIIAALSYALAITGATFVWSRIPVFNAGSYSGTLPALSVVIPVRNEANGIGFLLDDLARQSLPSELVEIIVVDDHSTDNTLEVLAQKKADITGLEIVQLASHSSEGGKKRAIATGISAAKHPIIVCTDGDCRVGPHWLRTVAAYFAMHQPDMLSGPVVLSGSGLFAGLQIAEFSSLIGVGAVSVHLKKPNMCNGANLAYKKSAFEAVNGYEGLWDLPSGDDEFLMQRIKQLPDSQIHFLKSPEAVVSTRASTDLSAFFQQRIRWASKWRQHKGVYVAPLALSVFTFHLLAVYSVILYTFTGATSILIFWILKIVAEFVFLNRILTFLGASRYSIYVLLIQPLYSCYAVLTGMFANTDTYRWKGRVWIKRKGTAYEHHAYD